MSHFKTFLAVMILLTTSAAQARVNEAEIQSSVRALADRYQRTGLSDENALLAAVTAENKKLPRDHQLRIAEQECKPALFEKHSKKLIVIAFAATMACLTFAASQAPAPAVPAAGSAPVAVPGAVR
jgi:hypothetical protein